METKLTINSPLENIDERWAVIQSAFIPCVGEVLCHYSKRMSQDLADCVYAERIDERKGLIALE